MIEIADGRAESPMESEARLVFIDGGLPLPELQYEIIDRQGKLWRVDFAWLDAMVVAEYESMDWHASPEALKHDRTKTARLQECGWTSIPIVVDDVRKQPRELVSRIFGHLARPPLAGEQTRTPPFPAQIGGLRVCSAEGAVSPRLTRLGGVLIGSHVDNTDPLAAAAADGADVVQFFLGNPQSWKKPKPREDAEVLKASTVPLYVHAPYLINVASANNRVRIPSRKILQDTCDAAAEIGATAVIVHGGHADDNDMEAGFERWVKALDYLNTDVPVYLENTAGGDHAMARHFDTIARLWDRIGDKELASPRHLPRAGRRVRH